MKHYNRESIRAHNFIMALLHGRPGDAQIELVLAVEERKRDREQAAERRRADAAQQQATQEPSA